MSNTIISPVYADFKPSWEGVYKASTPAGPVEVATFASFNTIFSNILNIIIILAGIVVFVMLILGGFGLLTSSGNPEKVKKAGGTLTNAIIGLIILLAIWFIFRFIENFTGIKVTQFEIPAPSV